MSSDLPVIGWREWVSLPGLKLPAIKAKVDTGAKTSCLHAFYVDTFVQRGAPWAVFGVHPLQKNSDLEITCTAPIVDERRVTDSGGHSEKRLVIESVLRLGGVRKKVEFTLTNRDTMSFRMLLGRQAIRRTWIVDPARSHVTGRELADIYRGMMPETN